MQHTPDGVEVVATRAAAAQLALPPLLVIEAISAWLDDHAIGPAGGELSWQRIGGGQSNITYLIERGTGADAARFVMRRGPRPPLPPSAHDMVREARVQRIIAGHGVSVPRILGVCTDETVLGVPFYVMEYLDGTVITDDEPPSLGDDAGRAAASQAVVETLAGLHAVDVTRPEVASLGRPEGYLERQVRRFTGLWPQISLRELEDFDPLARWLTDNCPPQSRHALVHGDYRLGNIMLDPGDPGQVLAVLDWEMATLGDPLADLGYLAATWSDPGVEPTIMDHSLVTSGPGWWRREDLLDHYATLTGADLTRLPWYQTLALWKSAVFCEAMRTRWLGGERDDDTEFAPRLTEGVPDLLRRAREHAEGAP